MVEHQSQETLQAEEAGPIRVGTKGRREDLFIVLGMVAVGLIVAFAGQTPGGVSSWTATTTAAAATAPSAAEAVARTLDALRGNVIAWRIISLVIIGGVAGMLASRVVPGRRAGAPAAVLIGIFGSALGGWVCQYFGYAVPTQVSVASVGVAFAGALVTLIVAKFVAHF